MDFKKLRKSHKKQIIIGAVAVCVIGGALTFNLTRAKYKLTESIPLVRGSVNYKVPDLRTVALYTANDSGTYVETNVIPTSGYGLNKTKSVCKVYDGTTSVEKAPIDSTITIEYTNGKVNFLGISKRNTRCYLYFDKQTTASETLIANSIKGSGTPTFSKTACTSGCEEATVGTYTVEDGMYGGTSTYWRGDTTDNYVSFANKCWRIVRINGDGSIRLIYDGTTCHANGTSTTDSIAIKETAYNTRYDKSEHVGWTYVSGKQRPESGDTVVDSNIKVQTEKWYNENIENNINYASKIADGNFCNDRNIGSGYSWSSQPSNTFYYAGYDRSGTKNANTVIPTLSCISEDTYILKAGAVIIDELILAGGKISTENRNYYLFNNNYYWTMSPNYFSGGSAYIFRANKNGGIGSGYGYNSEYGIRPVINLKSDTTFSDGNGTQSSPYIVS